MSCMAHHYNLDGRCPVMDGFDLLATTPTGSGKVGYLILLRLVVREIAADTALAIAKEILPRDRGVSNQGFRRRNSKYYHLQTTEYN